MKRFIKLHKHLLLPSEPLTFGTSFCGEPKHFCEKIEQFQSNSGYNPGTSRLSVPLMCTATTNHAVPLGRGSSFYTSDAFRQILRLRSRSVAERGRPPYVPPRARPPRRPKGRAERTRTGVGLQGPFLRNDPALLGNQAGDAAVARTLSGERVDTLAQA